MSESVISDRLSRRDIADISQSEKTKAFRRRIEKARIARDGTHPERAAVMMADKGYGAFEVQHSTGISERQARLIVLGE